MTLDPKLVNKPDATADDDTVVDPDLQPYDETVEKPTETFANYIPPEEL